MDGVGLTELTNVHHSEMRRVSITKNAITSVSSFALFFPKLEFLHIGHNRITSLPAGLLTKTPNVIMFDASHNHLTSLPDNMFYPCRTTVRRIVLDHNRLTLLPAKLFHNLYSLAELKVQNNRITALVPHCWY